MPVPRPTTVVPAFGDWESDKDVSYTVLFEKIRASKDDNSLKSQEFQKSSQMLNKRHPDNKKRMVYPQPECNKKNYVNSPATKFEHGKRITMEDAGEIRKKAPDLHSSSSRRSSLEQIADHIFTESQFAAGNDSPVLSHRSSSNGNSSQGRHSDRSRETFSREKHSNYSGMSCGSPAVANHQVHQARLQGNFSSGVTSSPRNGKAFSAASPTPHYKQQGSLQSRSMSSEMTSNRNLPTFGNWDAIDPDKVEFTVLFDKARNEKQNSSQSTSSASNGLTTKNVAPIVDEDLYKPAYANKSHTGFWTLFCCSKV